MRTISIPAYIWLPALTWLVTYLLTKYHGVKGLIKACTDFYM